MDAMDDGEGKGRLVLVPGDLIPTTESTTATEHPKSTRVCAWAPRERGAGGEGRAASSGTASASSAGLRAGDLVLCVVTRITQRAAFVSIRTRRGRRLAGDAQGILRLEDMRARGDTEKVPVDESYRPGDVVLAKVMATPRSGAASRQSVRLSTAGERLGCVMGKSYASMFVLTPGGRAADGAGAAAGRPPAGGGSRYETTASGGHILRFKGSTLSPQSWEQMRCAQTGIAEKRKVARPMHHK